MGRSNVGYCRKWVVESRRESSEPSSIVVENRQNRRQKSFRAFEPFQVVSNFSSLKNHHNRRSKPLERLLCVLKSFLVPFKRKIRQLVLCQLSHGTMY
jgi:hypothetical protein